MEHVVERLFAFRARLHYCFGNLQLNQAARYEKMAVDREFSRVANDEIGRIFQRGGGTRGFTLVQIARRAARK